MVNDGQELSDAQRRHWQHTYTAHPGMYGQRPSSAAVHAAGASRTAGAEDVLELGAGHGRDALFFAGEGFTVRAIGFSATGLQQLRGSAEDLGISDRVTTMVHDLREPLPLPSACTDAVFAHMLLCMTLSTDEIHSVVGEVRRVLRPGGTFVYTIRHTGDTHCGQGTAHGDDIYEHGGFAVHFFPRDLVYALAAGWTLQEVHAFEEGALAPPSVARHPVPAPISPEYRSRRHRLGQGRRLGPGAHPAANPTVGLPCRRAIHLSRRGMPTAGAELVSRTAR